MKAIFEDSKKVKRITNYVSKYNLYLYFLIYQNLMVFDEKFWCQQNSRGVPSGSYIFRIFFRKGITVPSFIIVGYVWKILGSGDLFEPTLPLASSSEKAHP